MIRRLSIKNFKSVRQLWIECRRVNIFIGEPNTGKSNILEALGLISMMAFRDHSELFVRVREPHQLFYNYNVREEVRVSLDEHEVVGRFTKEGYASFYDEGRGFLMAIRPDGKQFSKAPPISSSIRFYRFKSDVKFRKSDKVFLLPPCGSNLPSVLMLNPSLRQMVYDIFEDYGQRLAVDPHEPSLSVAWELEGVLQLLPYELASDTLRRFIFHLAAVESNKGAIITMEEPEAHAFPTYTKLLAERIALDKSNQYFITTHNPYFLLSLAEKTPARDLAIYITYLHGRETRAKLLSEDELADLMDLASAVFFNLDRFLKDVLEAPGP